MSERRAWQGPEVTDWHFPLPRHLGSSLGWSGRCHATRRPRRGERAVPCGLGPSCRGEVMGALRAEIPARDALAALNAPP